MAREVVEVVARFAGTIIDIAHVGPDGAYRIGTAPGTDFVMPGLTCFPLVDGTTVRCPVGMQARDDGRVTELRAGDITLHVARTMLATPVLARPRVEWRMPLFLFASLIAHLAVWLAAESYADLERVAFEKPRRHARLIARPEPPPIPERERIERERAERARVEREPRFERKRAPGHGKQSSRRARAEADPALGESGDAIAEALARVAKSFDDTRVVERVSALTEEGHYDEDAANAEGFGGRRRFDPSQREGYGTIETGAYKIMVYNVKLCPKKSCSVVGPVPPLYVRTHLHAHMDAIYECYMTHAPGPGTVVLELTITADGAVRDASGTGLGETGACVARVAEQIVFRAFGSETRVRYPIVFK